MSVLFKTVFPVAVGVGLWYVLIDRGNEKIREEFQKSHGKANQSTPLAKNREKEMMVATILGGGASDLSKVREETTKKRLQMADEYYKKPIETRDQE